MYIRDQTRRIVYFLYIVKGKYLDKMIQYILYENKKEISVQQFHFYFKFIITVRTVYGDGLLIALFWAYVNLVNEL